MYRIACTFDPKAPTMAGSGQGGFGFKRGGWRVAGCWYVNSPAVRTDIYCASDPGGKALGILSSEPRRVGTRINPRKVLYKYLADRRGLTDE